MLMRNGVIGNERVRVLIDTGSSFSLITNRVMRRLRKKVDHTGVVTIAGLNGQLVRALGTVVEELSVDNVACGPVKFRVMANLPVGADCILGLDVLARVGLYYGSEGLWLGPRPAPAGAGVSVSPMGRLKIKDRDFVVTFDGDHCTAQWVWKDVDSRPRKGPVNPYRVDGGDKEEFDAEVRSWIKEGILVSWDPRRHGAVRNFVPLMAVKQEKKNRVRPVFDFRELNTNVESRPGDKTPVCHEQMRKWRQFGVESGILDLKLAYLQIRVDPTQWRYQAVRFEGRTYLLTRLGFGLAPAPKMMTAIVGTVLGADPAIRKGTGDYIDDICVDEGRIDPECVKRHVEAFGLNCKPLMRFKEGDGEALGMQLTRKGPHLYWRRKGQVEVPDGKLTRRRLHAVVGELAGHYPVCGWLRMFCGMLQRVTAKLALAWDEVVPDWVAELLRRAVGCVREADPVKGQWDVNPAGTVVLWTDASAQAIGVVLEVDGAVVEDGAWLRKPRDATHINIAELDAVVKGLNLALRWGFKRVEIKTDSATVNGWLKSVLEETHRVKTKGMAEMLVKRRLGVLWELIDAEGLKLRVTQVPSAENMADAMTRLLRKWMRALEAVEAPVACVGQIDFEQLIVEVHSNSHMGVKRTRQLVEARLNRVLNAAECRMVERSVRACHACARIDPPIVERWDTGSVRSTVVWKRLTADLTHVDGKPYLSVKDTASRFVIFERLRDESAGQVALVLQRIFMQFGPPYEFLTDNGTVFRSRQVADILARWTVQPVFSAAYRPQGNGSVESCHRMIKRMVARSGQSPEEACFWYNVTCGDDQETSPFEQVFGCQPKLPGISDASGVRRPLDDNENVKRGRVERNPFKEGDRVYLRPVEARCTTRWSGPHVITKVLTNVTVAFGW